MQLSSEKSSPCLSGNPRFSNDLATITLSWPGRTSNSLFLDTPKTGTEFTLFEPEFNDFLQKRQYIHVRFIYIRVHSTEDNYILMTDR